MTLGHLAGASLFIAFMACFFPSVLAQNTGSVSGSVSDSSGALVREAMITLKGTGGQEYRSDTGDTGIFVISAVPSGSYRFLVAAPGFKRAAGWTKVDAGTPSTLNVILEAGEVSELVEVRSSDEPLQSQTATVSSTIASREIADVPAITRDALAVVTLTPGVVTVGRTSTSTVNGLPKSAITISIDGADVQDNSNRSWNGFSAYVSPRTDAVEEVTVSTSAPEAAGSGDGAVGISFVTRRGTNAYSGGLFWQHRNTALNSNYWYNNRDLPPDPDTGKAPRNRILLNQFGGRFGGPLPLPNFGTGGPVIRSGRDKAFFFVNYEEMRFPFSFTRGRTVLTPEARSGIYSYISGGTVQTIDLLQLAASNGQTATIDPTVRTLLQRIESGIAGAGSFAPIPNDPNRQTGTFMTSASDVRRYLALRFDFNLTPDQNLEAVINRQKLEPVVDFQRGLDPSFPGFSGFYFSSEPKSFSLALRSVFSGSLVNEARFTTAGGDQLIGTVDRMDFSSTGGFNLDIASARIQNPYPVPIGYGLLSEPNFEIRDSATWTDGRHTVSFGGQYKFLRSYESAVNWVAPVVGFGVDPSEGTAFAMFNSATMPGSTPAQQNDARELYAVLVGRVRAYYSFAYLNEQGRYVEDGPLTRELSLKTYGLFVQDRWRISPSLAVTFGMRWQPQEGFVVKTANAGRLEDPDMVWGISGPGNAFRPGVLEGDSPRVVLYAPGEKIYPDDLNNFAPSFGAVWSPEFKGPIGKLIGGKGDSVVRGGYSLSFIREGSVQQMTPIRNNPGGNIDISRDAFYGNVVFGTNFRDAGNPNLTAPDFSAIPVLPLMPVVAVATDPDIETGYVHSFSFGYQRRIGKDSVIEVRYVGNRGRGIRRTNFLNEPNTIENGFAEEFLRAQANLYANIAAGRGPTFAYFGEGTGTSPLPIILAYFNAPASYNPANPAVYGAANFSNFQLVSRLATNAADIQGFINNGAFEVNVARRANAVANGLPPNFFRVNPDVRLQANLLSDDASSWYDALAVEFRRRLSKGLRVQASYVFSKAMSNAFSSNENQRSDYTLREGGLERAKNFSPYDVRHQFKLDATYELPFGKGAALFTGAGDIIDQLVGGWSVIPVVRWQSGSPFALGNVQLVGMTKKELEREIRARKGPTSVTYLPADIILNTQRAFNISVTSPTGYGTTYGGPPEGRFIAPAGFGNCISRFPGECGFANLILHGPDFFRFDAAVIKRFRLGESRSLDFRITAFDLLNSPSFRFGGWDSDITGSFVGGSTFGQLPSGSAYQDLADSQYPGGRVIDLQLRLNF